MDTLQESIKNKIVTVSTATFFWFQVYQLEFFLHFSARFKFIGVMHPTVLLFLIVSFLLFSQKDKLKTRLGHPILTAYSAFLLLLLLTLPFVSFPGSVLKNNIPVFLKAIVFLYFAALILDTPKRFKWALVVFVCCQVFRVLEPLFLNITQGYWGDATNIDGENADRLGGAPADVINANELGFVIATVIPFLHYYLLPLSWKYKLLYFALLPPLLYALLLTMSRGAFLALLVVGWIIFKESKRKMMIVCFVVVIVVTALGVMNDNQRDRYLSLVSSDSKQTKSKEGRIKGMQTEFMIGLTRPVFGHGLGTTAETKSHSGYRAQAAHNMYAEVLIEVGFVGMFFLFRFVRRVYHQIIYSGKNLDASDEFYKTTAKIFKVVFWMFIVYSINYWGLTQYYWYNLAGLTIAFAFLSKTVVDSRKLR